MSSKVRAEESSKYQWRIQDFFPHIDESKRLQLLAFWELLLKYNKAINLIGPKTIIVGDTIHFADSILAAQLVKKDAPNIDVIWDFGSGNGFPGVVISILFPEFKVVCVDTDSRKCEFLKQVAASLGLTNLSVENKGIESLPPDSIKFAISRGLANISKTILLARKPFKRGGILYHMKSEQWGLEITEIPIQLCSIWSPELVGEYTLPGTTIKFGLVKTIKI